MSVYFDQARGTFGFRIEVPRDDPSGRRLQLHRRGFRTRDAAEAAARRARRERIVPRAASNRLMPFSSVIADQLRGERVEVVYFVRRLRDGYIKIGYSTNLLMRLATHRIEQGPLECFGAICGDRRLERQMHHRFGCSWAVGEWFGPSPRLLAYLGVAA